MEVSMKRLMLLVLGGLLVSGSAFAQATAAKTSEKTMTAAGSVTAVTADSLTVKGKSGEWTFAVDKDTHVGVAGATRKTAALKDNKVPAAITEYVKVGDSVTVKYHDAGATKHAVDVRVRSSAKK
jgi:hypothetical protein